MSTQSTGSGSPIAIVGLACIYPGAGNAAAFWKNVVDGADLVTEVPAHHWLLEDYYDPDPRRGGKTYARRGAFVSKMRFDPLEFGIPPSTLPSIDPVQILSLLAAKAVLEDCRSVTSAKVDRQNVGVILGGTASTGTIFELMGRVHHPNWRHALRESGVPEEKIEEILARGAKTFIDLDENSFSGALSNITTGRIANRLNLGGTNCVIDAACASSLAAVSMAMQELQLGKTDLVITGGADAHNDILTFMLFSKTTALSPSGDCRPFSDAADGTILGDGVGMVALRRLADAERDGDRIHAVIRGIGSSSDGRGKSVYAPSPAGQALAIRRAYADAGISPAEVELVEAHGTATRANDATEFESLCAVYRDAEPSRRPWCALGSIKSQIGHAKGAAGAASLIKAALALSHRVLPPTIKIERPNPELDFAKSPFYLNVSSRPWVHPAGSTRKAAVSSLGFGGTNFHVILEEYRGPAEKPARFRTSPVELILVSAGTDAELQDGLSRFEARLDAEPLAALARESQLRFDARASLRLALVASDPRDARAVLDRAREQIAADPGTGHSIQHRFHFRRGTSDDRLAFLFPGQGSQYLNMGKDLAVEFEPFRRVYDDLVNVCRNDETALHEIVFPPPVFTKEEVEQQKDRLKDIDRAQLAIGATSLGYLALIRDLGLRPACVGGHSYGEFMALHAAGVLSELPDLVACSRKCAELVTAAASSGVASGMTAVRTSVGWIKERLERWAPEVSVANVNAPEQIVLSGPVSDLENVEKHLASESIGYRRLPVTIATHSAQMLPAEEPLRRFLQSIPFATPRMPVYANSTGQPYPHELDRIRDTLAGQLSRSVLFKNQVEAMHDAGVRVFLEVGPGRVLSNLVSKTLHGKDHSAIALDGKPGEGLAGLWNALGMLAVRGIPLRFESLWSDFASVDRAPAADGTVEVDGASYGKPYPPARTDHPASPTPAVAVPPPAERRVTSTPLSPFVAASPPARPQPVEPPRMTDDWLATIERMQSDLLRAQKEFQESLTRSHLAFIEATSQSLALMARRGSGATPEGRISSPVTRAGVAADPAPAVAAASPPGSNPEPVEPAPSPERSASDEAERILVELVSQITGYPQDAIDRNADLEADLGIDSIKMVELLAEFRKRMPQFENLDPQALYSLRTLREIVEHIQGAASPPES